jgi:hypothetical protein
VQRMPHIDLRKHRADDLGTRAGRDHRTLLDGTVGDEVSSGIWPVGEPRIRGPSIFAATCVRTASWPAFIAASRKMCG